MCDDQMVLGIDSDLHVVPDDAGAQAAGRHRAGIGIGQGNLFVGRGLDLLTNLLEGLHLPPQALDSPEADCLCLSNIAVLPVGAIQGRQVARDAGLHLLNALRPAVAAEVGDRLEVRRQSAGQPHQLDVALGLPFEPPARLDAIEIAVEIDLQQRRGMIGGPARLASRVGALKPQRPQIQLVDEDVDHPH